MYLAHRRSCFAPLSMSICMFGGAGRRDRCEPPDCVFHRHSAGRPHATASVHCAAVWRRETGSGRRNAIVSREGHPRRHCPHRQARPTPIDMTSPVLSIVHFVHTYEHERVVFRRAALCASRYVRVSPFSRPLFAGNYFWFGWSYFTC
jgi:hypothetical protein